MRNHSFWQLMTYNVRKTVEECHSCANEGFQLKNNCKLQSRPAAGPLEVVAIAFLVSLPKLTSDNQHIDITPDRYLERTCVIPNYELTNNLPQSFSKLLKALGRFLQARKLPTAAIHPQENGQVEHCNCKIVTRLRHCVSQLQMGVNVLPAARLCLLYADAWSDVNIRSNVVFLREAPYAATFQSLSWPANDVQRDVALG